MATTTMEQDFILSITQFQDYKIPPEDNLILSSLEKYLIKNKSSEVRIAIVGGYVRDALLGVPSDDLDLAIEVHKIEISVETLVSKWLVDTENLIEYGISKGKFETIKSDITKVKKLDTIKAKISVLDQNKEVDFMPSIQAENYDSQSRIPTRELGDLELDAFRRDLTINALMLIVPTAGEQLALLDPTQGLIDLETKILRSPWDKTKYKSQQEAFTASFLDDPLRIVRVLRFKAKFSDFTIDANFWPSLTPKVQKEFIKKVAGDRKITEFKKVATYNSGRQLISFSNLL